MKKDNKTKRAPSPQSAPLPARAAVLYGRQPTGIVGTAAGPLCRKGRSGYPNRPAHINKNSPEEPFNDTDTKYFEVATTEFGVFFV